MLIELADYGAMQISWHLVMHLSWRVCNGSSLDAYGSTRFTLIAYLSGTESEVFIKFC